MSRDRLGRGLEALLGEYMDPAAPPDPAAVSKLPVASIVPNPHQPRRVFTEQELEELSASIRENGLLQPLVVRPAPGSPDRFELIAGERRLRAVSRLEWTDVPVVVRDASDDTLLVLALVENLQREQLNPIEEAEAYARLAELFEMSHEAIARSVGKSRSTVTNFVRLLALPPSIRSLVESGDLSQGHARALLAVEDGVRAADLARRAVSEGWSVREMERRVKADAPRKHRATHPTDPVVRALEETLRGDLGTRVEVRQERGGKGSIVIRYHDADDFGRIFEIITGRSATEVVE